MNAVRPVYRQEVLQPLLVALFLFQVGSGVRSRTFQIASGIFLAAYVLGHMNSVFVYAELYLGIDSDWAFATGAPAGLVKDAWNIRLCANARLLAVFHGLIVTPIMLHRIATLKARVLLQEVVTLRP